MHPWWAVGAAHEFSRGCCRVSCAIGNWRHVNTGVRLNYCREHMERAWPSIGERVHEAVVGAEEATI